MKKRKFLNELERKLYILNEEERKDIINEYKDTIEEKMKHGKSEEEAIEDFGSIDLLVEEILKAYKINPQYDKKEDPKVKDVFDKSESLIQKWAHDLSTFFQELGKDCKENGLEITLELIFEWILKGIFLLILCSLVKIPFALLEVLGLGIFDFTFSPFNILLGVVWKILLGILYFVVCILLGIAMFKQYFITYSKKNNKVEVPVKKNEKIEKKTDSFSPVFLLIKVFVILVLGIPCFFATIGLSFLFAFSIYLLTIGIPVIGLLLLSFGLLLLFGMTAQFAFELPRKRFPFFTILFSSILIVFGGFLSITSLIDYTYRDELPNRYSSKEEVYLEDIKEFTTISSAYDKTITINNDLPDGRVQIRVTYYDDYITIKKEEFSNQIKIQSQYKNHKRLWKKNYHLFLEDLKEKEIYNYSLLYHYHITIEVNENTRSQIR